MDYSDKIARYEEIERRGLLSQLPQEKQEAWAEYKRRQQPALQLSDEQKAQIQANNEGYAQRSEANRPWMDKNPIARLGIAALQGISNASLNPAGYVARAAGIDTKPFTPENAAERGVELAGEYGFDAAALGGAGNIAKGAGYLGKGEGLTSRVAQALFAPENITQMAVAPATAMGLGVGMADPSTEAGKFAVGMVSGMVPAFAQGAVKTTTQSVKTGLKNILGNNKGVKAVAKGTKASEEVAQQVANEAPEAYNQLNADMVQALDDAAGRKLNIANANTNQQQRYNDFIRDNADVELINFAPTKEQIISYPAETNFNLPKKMTKEKASRLLKERADKSNIDVMGKEQHYVNKRDRKDYTRTLSYSLENPDITYSLDGRDFVVKKYNGVSDYEENPFFDFIIKENGKLFNKFKPDSLNYINNQIDKNPQNVSLRANVPLGSEGIRPPYGTNNNITYENVVVNKNLPSLKQFTQGLDDFQKDALNQALSKGASMSTSAKGTLGATHRAQEVLNDMIEASYDTSIIGQRKPTTETRELMTVKERLKQILEPSGVKPYDAGISKAKSLQAAYEKGYNFKPSEVRFDNLGVNTLRDRKAMLQGVIDKITDNTLSDGATNLATAIKRQENTLRKLMPKAKFEALMNKAGEAETQFKRLKKLETQADNRLTRDAQTGSSPMRENTETKGSAYGRVADILLGWINRKSNTNLAKQYLNPSLNQVVSRGGLKGGFTNMAQTGLRQALIEAMDNN